MIIITISDKIEERLFSSSDEEEEYKDEEEESSGNIFTYIVGDFVQGIGNFKGGVISGVFRAKANVANGILNAKGNVFNGIANGIVNGWEHTVKAADSSENWINVKCIVCFLIDKYIHFNWLLFRAVMHPAIYINYLYKLYAHMLFWMIFNNQDPLCMRKFYRFALLLITYQIIEN